MRFENIFCWVVPRRKENLFFIIFTLFFFLVVFSFVFTLNKYINPSGYDEEGDVLNLHASDFDAALAEFKYLMVQFCKFIL
jgi:hypothetical protein